MPNKLVAQYQESMTDLGEEYPKMSCGCDDCKKDSEEDKKKKKHYPRETFSTDQMPSLSGVDVGDKVSIVIEGEVVAKSKGDMWGGPEEDEDKTKTRITVKMISGFAEKAEKEDDSDIEAMTKQKKKEELDLENLSEKKDEEY